MISKKLEGNLEQIQRLRELLAGLRTDQRLPELDAPSPSPGIAVAAERLARSAANLRLAGQLELRNEELLRAREFLVEFGRTGVPEDFDEEGYLARYPDVLAGIEAGLFESGYDHWRKRGMRQNRLVQAPGGDWAGARSIARFDEDTYLMFNPDVAEAIREGRVASAHAHWLKYGQVELRPGGLPSRAPDRAGFLPELERRRYGVNLYGFLSSTSGMGTNARGCAKALASRSIPMQGIDVEPWKGGLELRTHPECEPYRINLILQNADMFERFLRAYGAQLLNGAYNIGYWAWELPSARSDWHHVYQFVDEIWAPSEFVRQSLQALTALDVRRVPHVVNGLDEKAIFGRDHFQFPKDVFVFCYVFDVSSYLDRKNPFSLIEAFRREFKDSPDVLLYLKIWNAGYDETRSKRLLQAVKAARNIRVYNGLFSEEEIISLHKAIDCFVSPHRSEGFGLNLAEAMYFGKPVIATRYSGNLDYMTDENSYLIDYKLTPILHTVGPYVKGAVWAEPSIDHLRHQMRRVFAERGERERKGQRAAEQIRSSFNASVVGEIMAKRFADLHLDQEKLKAGLFRRHELPSSSSLFLTKVRQSVRDEIRDFEHKPVVSVITPVYNVRGAFFRACIESVRAQSYPFWELCLVDDASSSADTRAVLDSYRGIDPRIKIVREEQNRGIAGASNRAVEISTGEFLAFLDNDDELTQDALLEVVKALNACPEADYLYSDEDKIEQDGRYTDHYYKPDWSPEHLRSVMYLLHLIVIRKELFYHAGAFRDEFSGAQDYDLALRATARARSVHHIPKILYHWRKLEGSAAAQVDAKPKALDAGRRALEDFVASQKIDAQVEPGILPGHFRVRHSLRNKPRATLCILTHDIFADVPGRGRINLVEHFVKSIADKTDYRNYEILIVDDANLSARTKSALKGIDYRVSSFRLADRPFNYAAKANFAVKQVRTEHLVLLNDDMEVIGREWLSALLEFTQQPEIGAAGARLLFPDNRVQHVGVAVGVNGGSAHVYHNYPADFVGYNGFTHIVRNYSAVTAACLATRKEVVERAGGFDERLAIDYNDIDFCLAVLDKGYRIVYTPYAELYHFEGRSAPRQAQNPEEVALFRSKWPQYFKCDPYYNPNLTRSGVDFAAGC